MVTPHSNLPTLPTRRNTLRLSGGALLCLGLIASVAAQTPPPADPDATSPASSPAQNRPAKQLPPRGIEIPESEQTALRAAVEDLVRDVEALRAANLEASLARLLPDVEIYIKAVDWALRYREFHDPREFKTARELLEEGRSRARALYEGKAPWTQRTGLVVRAFRSRIDGSLQPYGVVVPSTWGGNADRKPRPAWIWNHGRGDTLSELAFMAQRSKSAGEFEPPDTFVIHPYGRFCNATKFAGETDVFEALEAAGSAYPLDDRRIVNAGFSMGGASAWHLAVHHPDRWAASHPGAGFAETAEYAGVFAPGKIPPPWWEQILWRWYDATACAANLASHPVLAYHGSEDKQGQATAIMRRFADRENVRFSTFVGPGVGHRYEPETKRAIAETLHEILESRPKPPPNWPDVDYVTYSLIYPSANWITLLGLQRHWERAEVSGTRTRPAPGETATVHLRTRNVTRLRISPPAGADSSPGAAGYRIRVDGQLLTRPATGTTTIVLRDGHWEMVAASTPDTPIEQIELRKRPGLCGPIDHAFLSSFLFVEPTGTPFSPSSGEWTRRELELARERWRALFRGEPRSTSDRQLSDAEIAAHHLVLWGDPASNLILARIADRLPIQWTDQGIRVGDRTFPPNHVPVLIFPNPLNPAKYIVLNTGFTFSRAIATGTNSQQTPKLPDWAIVDASSLPDDRFPGRIADAGFFDETWQLTSDRPR